MTVTMTVTVTKKNKVQCPSFNLANKQTHAFKTKEMGED